MLYFKLYSGVLCLMTLMSCNSKQELWNQAIKDPAAAHLAIPTEVQYNWQEMERGMFIQLDPATIQEAEYDNGTTPLHEIKFENLAWMKATPFPSSMRRMTFSIYSGFWLSSSAKMCTKSIASPFRVNKGVWGTHCSRKTPVAQDFAPSLCPHDGYRFWLDTCNRPLYN